jgi:predicted dehydrogenase
VIELAEGRSAPVWVGLEYRYMPPVARLLEEVRSGVTGPVKMIAIREHRFPFLEKVGDWNRFTRNTGGTLVEKCCHFFDLMNLIVRESAGEQGGGQPVRVLASGAQDVNHLDEDYGGERPDVIDNAFVIVEYDNGVRASLDLCMFADATRNQEEISVVGPKGKLEALIPEDVLRIGRRGEHWIGGVEEHHIENTIAYQGHHHGSSLVEHGRLLEIIRSGGRPEVTVHDGLMSVAIGVAAHRSIDEGRAVPMSEVLHE